MDERHWWIASKIQETFKIGGYDNPTLLEDFMIEDVTLGKINKFLKSGGPCRLFFYCEKPETGVLSTRELHVTGTLASLKDTNLERVNILYFLRNRVDKDVDGTRMERDIFCGELKHNTIETLTTLLSDVYIPLVKAQKDWGECNPDGQSQLMNNMDKFLTALNESTASLQSSKQMMLKQPDHVVLNDFKQQRAAALDPQLINQYEELVTEWMNTIEAVLTDTSDERFMDPNAGPLSELERWRRRQRLLTNITEQLKGKECKAVIGVLITAKSRLLKKWKTIDAAITDGMNDTKDKVKFLESLKRHFDQLYSVESTPASIINNAIPGLANSVKQMDSISRYYSRTGFLDDDLLWDRIEEEIEYRDTSTDVDPKIKLLKSQVESKLKDDTLYGRLKACLTLQGFYRETLRSLRDSIGQSQNMSHFPSMSSIGGPSSFTTRSNRGVMSGTSRLTGSSPKKGVSTLLSDVQGHGVPLTDEEAIMSHFDLFCNRIRQLIDVINTLAQYTKLVKSTRGVPKPRKEDLVIDDGSEQEEWRKYKKPEDAKPKQTIEFEDDDPDLAAVHVKMNSPDRSLRVIEEDEEVVDDGDDGDTGLQRDDRRLQAIGEQGDEMHDVTNGNQGITEEELAAIKHVTNMTMAMSDSVTTKTMLDVESKDKDRFDDHYSGFQKISSEMERFLASYLHVIFCRKMKTQQGLDIITRLQSIQNRPGIRATLAEKFVEIFNWYEADLEEVQRIYESHKLLKRIEDPMKIFRDNKAITQLGDFGRIVKIYNRLATALVTFESLWFTQWKARIDQARNGLRATLFVYHPITNEIVVNADERVLELIHEAKWLTRLGIQIPESAAAIMAQESRFKNYKSHLELVLNEYRQVCESIPDPLRNLFTPHTEYVNQQLQPGLNTLAWNSMNIDAFLHLIHSATSRLRTMQAQVQDVMEKKVFKTLDTITNFYLFDHPPELFREEMLRTVEERSAMLQDYVEMYSLVGMSMSNLSASAFQSKKKAGSMESVKKCITQSQWSHENLTMMPDPHGKGKRVSVMVDPEEVERERQKAQQEEQLVLDLIAYFRDHVYEAVLSATSRSLALLAESSGCDSEVVRVISAMSNHSQSSSGSSPEPVGWGSQGGSYPPSPVPDGRAASANARPMSSLSQLSTMTWTTEKTHHVEVKFSIPTIIVEPTLDVSQTAVADVAKSVLEANRGIVWTSARGEESFYDLISDDENVGDMMSQLACVVHELEPVVNKHLFHFSYYNFLWKDDMHGNFKDFISRDPGMFAIKKEVERFLYIEKKVLGIPRVLPVGPICLQTDPIKDALHGFSMAWKTQFASVLHEEAKKKLDQAVLYRSNVNNRLELHVQTLDQLNSTLHLLEELRDMENKIDGIYLPIETMYDKLREFELRLPRNEVEEVDSLRENWFELCELAEHVREVLLKERRGAFEQELDKQVKTFVVEVIQFRNAFDAQGPAVPGIPPAEAVSRLQDFQQRYGLYDSKRKTLDSVSKLFGIPCKPFSELDKTGEELDLLSQLYGLFQKFIRFDTRFCDTLWAEVDLDASYKEVESYWDECLALPSKLKDWDACIDLKTKLQTYLEVFPLLNSLAAKLRYGEENPLTREIRNRHWLQVMQVTGSSFQLEANVFKLCHLLDIGLIKHKTAIEEICLGASRELELEIKMRMTEEEWTEQVLAFEPYIGPLRDEAASWAEKLKEVAEVLELWLEVQDLWQYLEAVFSNQVAAKELPQEAKRFARIDKSWTKMMKRAFDTRNVLQCCYGGEVPKAVLLRHVYEELEICFKSLVGYLDNKRRVFPRFYFVSDPILLAILSRPTDLESVKPHLKSIFASINDVKLEETRAGPIEPTDEVGFPGSNTGLRSGTPGSRAKTSSVLSTQNRGDTPPKIDKRLTQIYGGQSDTQQQMRRIAKPRMRTQPRGRPAVERILFSSTPGPQSRNMNPSILQQGPTYLPSEGMVEEVVTLTDEVETWVSKLRDSVCKTIREMNIAIIQDCNSNVPIDEWALKYPAQVCRMGMLYHWTRECDLGIADIKYDRKALQGTLKKYISTVSKLSSVLARGQWRSLEEPMLPLHKNRLECMITTSQFLRDALDNLCQRKLREVSDFEWRRCMRCYYQPVGEERMEPLIWILDTSYQYGNEFYGMSPGVALTPVTEKCFLTMSQALQRHQGSSVTGPVGSGKTETIKGLANVLGQFLAVFQCSDETDPTCMSKIIQGSAMDGCWCCFDESQALGPIAMAMMMENLESVVNALKARHAFTTLADGQEIPLKRSVAVHMTINLSDWNQTTRLSSDIRLLFRSISLVRPDVGMIMRAKCTALGFKAPIVLGSRLKVLTELAKDQLPPQIQHHFSIEALVGVLRRAMQKRKYIRDEKTQDKMDMKKEETSRSNSQASDSRPNLPQQSSTAGHRKTGTPNPMTAAGKLEHALVAQTIEEMISPRLMGEAMPIFKALLKDCFHSLPEPPPVIGAISARTRGFDIDQALETKAKERGLIPHKSWLSKCNQLYNLSSVHHGLIVAGPPGSGKSTCIQTLIDSLSMTPKAGLSRGSSGSKGSAKSSEKTHKLIRINPLVVDESDLMFGHLNQNSDWVDGIFTNACRKANRNLSKTWLCLDGPLNTGWADNFNSVLNSDKVLHLRNGDKLFLSDNINIIFETARLPEASPSTVSRCGILYIDKDVVGWKPIARAWLENRTPQEIHEKDEQRVLQRAFQKTLDPVINFVLNDAKPRVRLSEVGMFKTCLGLLAAMLADNIEIGGELHIERLYLFCLIWTFGGLLDAHDRKVFSDLLKTLSTALPDDDRDICVFDYYVDESGEWDPWISRVPEAVYADNQNMLGEVFVDTVDTIRTRILMDFASASGQNVLLVGAPGSGKTTLIDEFMDFQESNIYHRQGFVYGAKEGKKLKVFIDDVNLPVPDQYNVQRCNQLLRQLLDDKVVCTLQKPFEWKTVEDFTVISAMSMSEFPSVNNQMLSSRLLRHFAVFNLPGPQDDALRTIVHGILEANVTDNDKPGLEIDLHNNIVKASCQILAAVQSVLRPTPLPGRYHYLFTLKDLTTCYQCLKRLPDESMADELMVVSLWKHEMNRIIRDRISRSSDLNWFDEILEKTLSQYWPKLEAPVHEHFVTFPTDARLYQRPVTSVGAKHIKIALQPVETLRDLHSCLHTHLTRYNEEFGNVRLNIMLSDFVIAHIIRIHRVLSFHHGGNMLIVGAVGCHLTTLCQLALHVADVQTLKMDTSKPSNFFDGLRSAVRLTGSEGKILTLVFTARDLEDPVYLDAINSLLISGEYPHLFSNDELEGLLLAIGPSMKREFPSMSVDAMKFFIARVRCNLHIVICIQPGHDLLKIAAREHVTTCLANIHSFVLRDCRQMPWAGDLNPEISLTAVKQHEKKKDQLKVSSSKVPNLPYSKVILHERIRVKHRGNEIAKNEMFVGPTTFRRFMESFRYLYTVKSRDRTHNTRNDAKVMKKAIKNTTGKFEEAKVRTEELLIQLSHKATILEKLKAKVGLSTSLDAYLHLNEMETEQEEEDELLKQGAKTQVEECRKNLEYAREQVVHWKSKVDKGCIERLRAFSSPPVLVGQVMEMVMILIGKRLPSQRIETREYPTGKDEMSSRMSSSSSGTKVVKKSEPRSFIAKKDDSTRVDRTQWKGITNTMNDSTKFVDMLRNVSWEDGLPEDVLRGEGTLLENAADISIHAKKRTQSPDNSKGITIANAKYSSEDSATLVQYTIAIVEYTRRCGPLKSALERMHELQREIEENDRLQREKEKEPKEEETEEVEFQEQDYDEDDLPGIQADLNALQTEFDQAVVEKHSLEMELISMNERLKAATEMVESMRAQEGDWKQHVKDNDCNELLLANCVSAAAFLTYCGPHNMDTRKRMGEFFMQVCEHHGMPLPKKSLFRNLQMVDFLYTPLDIMHLEIKRLPTSPLMLENAVFLMQEESLTAWPLVCDPTSRIIDWLRFYMKDKNLVEVRYSEIRSQLENCLADGSPLLVTDCDIEKLAKDSRFRYAIQRCTDFIHGKNRFKIIVEDHEVECDPRFRLFLHTTVEPHMVPQSLAAYAAERQENMEYLDKLERQMRTNLSSDVRLMNDLQATKKLAELKKQFDETVESQTRVELSEGSILKARDGFRSIAQRAAVCFDVTQYMREANPLYQISSAVKAVLEKVTTHAYYYTARALMEKDRFIYALALALEVEDSMGRIGIGEREFLISPDYSSVVMLSLGHIQPNQENKITQAKKPFDWMTDDQFHNLQVLATHFDWFQEMFDRMPKDGRETQWRGLCETESPETVALPDKMDDIYKPMQRLCVVRAVRSDKVMHAATVFINTVLGKK
ncbi:DYHG-like protein [Mya arenaria]|uniref:DYHG-like protein n=1 Tax=Mya arenaria TaxID=6604 RepID=A0ABY7EH08_MYAAR|nr:DYHG-like protein [Mya arenaria]